MWGLGDKKKGVSRVFPDKESAWKFTADFKKTPSYFQPTLLGPLRPIVDAFQATRWRPQSPDAAQSKSLGQKRNHSGSRAKKYPTCQSANCLFLTFEHSNSLWPPQWKSFFFPPSPLTLKALWRNTSFVSLFLSSSDANNNARSFVSLAWYIKKRDIAEAFHPSYFPSFLPSFCFDQRAALLASLFVLSVLYSVWLLSFGGLAALLTHNN